MDFLFKFLGGRADDAGRITSMAMHLRNGDRLAVLCVTLVLLGALAVWTYRRSASHLGRLQRGVLTGLRFALLVLLVLMLLRPVLAFTIEGSVRRLLVFLFDTSASMQIRDPRVTDADIKRAALVKELLNPAKGLGQPLDRKAVAGVSRLARVELMKAALTNPDLNLIERLRREYDLAPFQFGSVLGDLPSPAQPEAGGDDGHSWSERLDPQSPQTALGDAIRDAINRKRGQSLAGVVVVTDGASNSGSSPMDGAAYAGQEGVPLFIYGVGITSPRDILVPNLFTQEVAFVKDEVAVNVRVRGQGLKGESAQLTLTLGDKVVGERQIDFAGDEEQIVSMKFTPAEVGDFELRAAIPPRDDETVKDNNTATQRIRVIDSRIKVLYVEQSPRWEWRYVQAILLRDRRVDLKCVLIEGDPAITAGEGTPYLAKVPEDKAELFKFDLIVIGDVDPKTFTAAQLEAIGDFVSKFGGALMMIAGKRFSPHAYRNTTIEKMLPVELESFDAAPAVTDKPVTLAVTPAGRASPMLRLTNKEEDNDAVWRKFPPVYWVAKVARAKPAAQVLVVNPDPALETRFGKMPVIALQQYGVGQVLFIGTDNLWRWRRNLGEQYYTNFWGQVTERMALPHLLGASKRTQLSADKQEYATGERVTLYARLYKESFEPVTEESVRGACAVKGGAGRREVQLRPIPEQPGMYRGEFVAGEPGTYAFGVEQNPDTSIDFGVTEPRFELGESAMNEPLLKQMAATTGGTFFREEDLYRLPETIGQKAEHVRSVLELEVWSSPFYFALILAVVSAEWLLRKRWQLK